MIGYILSYIRDEFIKLINNKENEDELVYKKIINDNELYISLVI
jgi:membrane protease subunit (stomatin/prohibitin family)